MGELADLKEERLYQRVTDILSDSLGRVARTVNTEMVNAYWRIGREIVEVEQQGQDRANYGALVINRLAVRLRLTGARGLGLSNLKQMRRFYLVFPEGTSAATKLLDSHEKKSQTLSGQFGRFHPGRADSHRALPAVPAQRRRTARAAQPRSRRRRAGASARAGDLSFSPSSLRRVTDRLTAGRAAGTPPPAR